MEHALHHAKHAKSGHGHSDHGGHDGNDDMEARLAYAGGDVEKSTQLSSPLLSGDD